MRQPNQVSEHTLQAALGPNLHSQDVAVVHTSEPSAHICVQQHAAAHPTAAVAVNNPASSSGVGDSCAGLPVGQRVSASHATSQSPSADATQQDTVQLSALPAVTASTGLVTNTLHMLQPESADHAQQAEATHGMSTVGTTAPPLPSSNTAQAGSSKSVYNTLFPAQLSSQQQHTGKERPVDSTASLVQAEAEAARLRAVMASSSRSVSPVLLDDSSTSMTLLPRASKPQIAASEVLTQRTPPHAKLTSKHQIQKASYVPPGSSRQHAASESDVIIPDR